MVFTSARPSCQFSRVIPRPVNVNTWRTHTIARLQASMMQHGRHTQTAQPRRAQSSLHRQTTNEEKAKQETAAPNQPRITFRQFAGRALGAGLRNLATAISPSGIRRAYQESPGLTSISVIILLFTLGLSTIAVRSYMQAFYNAEFSKFPKPVADTLRKAIYYTNIKADPELALKYYKRAMQQCAEVGLDPFSDEVLGIRIQVSFWLEKIGSYQAAVDVLEAILADCRKWVDVMEQSVKEGKVNEAGLYKGSTVSPGGEDAAKNSQSAKGSGNSDTSEQNSERETLWRKRERLLAKAVGTSVKLGELYADEHVLKRDISQKHLVWAVETALKEFRRRKLDGTNPGEQHWLSAEELGGSMESLGRDYERRSQFDLAVPLFFQALRLCNDPCHRTIIMNNLAAAFAQYPLDTSAQAMPSEELRGLYNADIPTTRAGCLEAAENWAKNAYSHAKDVQGGERTTECDEGCAVALYNWGEVAVMMGRKDLARRKYTQCLDMSNKLAYGPGIDQSRARLAQLEREM